MNEKNEREKQLKGRVLIDEVKCNLPLRLKVYQTMPKLIIPHIVSGIEQPEMHRLDMKTYLKTYLSGKKIDIERELITTKQLLYERLHGNEQDRDLLITSDITTGDVLIEDPTGSGEVIIGRYDNLAVKKLVHSINRASSDFKTGTLPISPEQYQSVKKDAYIINPEIVRALRKNSISKQKVTEELLEYLVEDSTLIKDTMNFVDNYEYGFDRSPERRTLDLVLPHYSRPGLQLLEISHLISPEEIYPDFREKARESLERDRLCGYPYQKSKQSYSSHSSIGPHSLDHVGVLIGVAKKSSVIESIESNLKKALHEAEQYYK